MVIVNWGVTGEVRPVLNPNYSYSVWQVKGYTVLMGPYVPLVDYLDPAGLSQPAGVPSGLPSAQSCGVLPNKVSAGYDSPTANTPLNFPQQYWPPATTGALNCATSISLPPQIYFAATEFPTPATTQFGQSCNTATQPNPCNQIVEQATQTTAAPGTWQPSLPVKIMGANLGFLRAFPFHSLIRVIWK